jgi:ribonuclease HI
MQIWVDGNPYAYAIVTENGHIEIKGNKATHNVNEYLAHKLAVEWCIKNGIKEARIISDSQLVSYQLSGDFHIKDSKLREIYLDIWKLIEANNLKVDFVWRPRKENRAGKLLG